MRIYPSDDYDKEELERLNAEPWMVELLKCNPEYPFFGNYEDYMIKDSGWYEDIGNKNDTEEFHFVFLITY